MYWNINKVLSYDKLFNFIVGSRGVGKTFGAKEYVTKNFLKKNSQFVYLRRYKEELKNNEKFFDDLKDFFPEVEFSVKGRKYFINGLEAGTALALTQARNDKSTPFPRVETIIFDEFIIDKGYQRYLPNEVTNFLEEYSTISRDRDIKVLFLSNALTITNPYFLYFDFYPSNKEFSIKGDLLIQVIKDSAYTDKMKNTRFGKLIDGTSYGSYAIDNKFFLDNNNFIKKKNGDYKSLFSFDFQGNKYGVWYNYKEATYIVSYDVDPSNKLHYCFTHDDHSPNTVLLKGNKSTIVKSFIETYKLGGVYFEDVNIKNIINKVMRMSL